MSRILRRRLFFLLVGVFLILGSTVAFYANGFRFDPRTFAFTKVGAVYVRSFPSGAHILLDGKPVKTSRSIFESGVLIDNLFPKSYVLTLSRQGYRPWQKHVAVKPSLVTEVKYAVLLPATPEVFVKTAVRDFWLINGEPLLERAYGDLVWRDKKLAGTRVIGWSNDFKHLLTADRGAYFWNDLEKGAASPLGYSGDIVMDPHSNLAIVLSPTSIISVNPHGGAARTIVRAGQKEVISSVAPSRFLIAWTKFSHASGTSQLELYDKFSHTIRTLPEYIPGRTEKLTWSDNRIGILEENGELYVYEAGSDTLAHLGSDIKDFSWNNDGTRLAALARTSIEVFALDNDEGYARFNPPEVERAEKLVWYRDDKHLFVKYPDRVAFLDLEDLGIENLATLAKTTVSYYDRETNALYFLENGSIMTLKFPR